MNTVEKEEKEEDPEEIERQERIQRMPILEQCYNLMDFEAVARRVMKKTAWAYYSSGADDEMVSFARYECGIPRWEYRSLTRSRPCERTTPPSTRSGSVHGYCRTWRILTPQRPCSAPKSPFLST